MKTKPYHEFSKQNSKKLGVKIEVLQEAIMLEKTHPEMEGAKKLNYVQVVTGCTEEQAERAFSFIFTNLEAVETL